MHPERLCLFGRITHENMVLNDPGNVVNQSWQYIQTNSPDIQLNYMNSLIKPKHIPGIIEAEYF